MKSKDDDDMEMPVKESQEDEEMEEDMPTGLMARRK